MFTGKDNAQNLAKLQLRRILCMALFNSRSALVKVKSRVFVLAWRVAKSINNSILLAHMLFMCMYVNLPTTGCNHPLVLAQQWHWQYVYRRGAGISTVIIGCLYRRSASTSKRITSYASLSETAKYANHRLYWPGSKSLFQRMLLTSMLHNIKGNSKVPKETAVKNIINLTFSASAGTDFRRQNLTSVNVRF